MSGLFARTAALAFFAGTVLTAPFAAIAAEPADDATFEAQASDTELSESRGAFLPITLGLVNAEQTAQDTNNVVIGGVTGSNSITGGFNTTGLVNVIQNSGNNVVIQSSTVVNMTFNK